MTRFGPGALLDGTLGWESAMRDEETVERDVPVPIRDGTVLYADAHRPVGGGPHPVLLLRTPYEKQRALAYFQCAPHVVRAAWVRGRGRGHARPLSVRRSVGAVPQRAGGRL